MTESRNRACEENSQTEWLVVRRVASMIQPPSDKHQNRLLIARIQWKMMTTARCTQANDAAAVAAKQLHWQHPTPSRCSFILGTRIAQSFNRIKCVKRIQIHSVNTLSLMSDKKLVGARFKCVNIQLSTARTFIGSAVIIAPVCEMINCELAMRRVGEKKRPELGNATTREEPCGIVQRTTHTANGGKLKLKPKLVQPAMVRWQCNAHDNRKRMNAFAVDVVETACIPLMGKNKGPGGARCARLNRCRWRYATAPVSATIYELNDEAAAQQIARNDYGTQTG